MDDRWVTASAMAVEGAGCGVVATTALSALMLGWQRRVGGGRLAPALVTDRALFAVNARPSRPARALIQTAAHFAFGTMAGAAYGAVTSALPRVAPLVDRCPPVLRGAGYGLSLWAVSYGAALPTLNILPPPSADQPGRQWRLVAAHLVYGATLGLTMGV